MINWMQVSKIFSSQNQIGKERDFFEISFVKKDPKKYQMDFS